MLNSRTNRCPMTRLARFGSLGVLVLVSILVAGLQAGSVSASRFAELIGSAVEQEPSTEPSSEHIQELVARAAALQAQLQTVLDELQAVLNDPDRPAAPSNELIDGGFTLSAVSADAVRDASNEPIRIGGGITPPAKIQDVSPVYPPEAQTTRVQGLVVMEITIGPTGEVTDVEVLESVPELDEAAVAAVEQWRYEPTLVDGEPVPVLMTVIINFRLRSP